MSGRGSSHGVVLISNQKLVGYCHDIYATTAQDILQTGDCCRSQDLQMGVIDEYLCLPVAVRADYLPGP